jgi:hypothetical protein
LSGLDSLCPGWSFLSARNCSEGVAISNCFLNSVDPFDYLTTLEKHHTELDTNPERWMPWNYRNNVGNGV